jgi:hypothetical protein
MEPIRPLSSDGRLEAASAGTASPLAFSTDMDATPKVARQESDEALLKVRQKSRLHWRQTCVSGRGFLCIRLNSTLDQR